MEEWRLSPATHLVAVFCVREVGQPKHPRSPRSKFLSDVRPPVGMRLGEHHHFLRSQRNQPPLDERCLVREAKGNEPCLHTRVSAFECRIAASDPIRATALHACGNLSVFSSAACIKRKRFVFCVGTRIAKAFRTPATPSLPTATHCAALTAKALKAQAQTSSRRKEDALH